MMSTLKLHVLSDSRSKSNLLIKILNVHASISSNYMNSNPVHNMFLGITELIFFASFHIRKDFQVKNPQQNTHNVRETYHFINTIS